MPNITEYNAPELRIQPTEIGVESQAAAGRRLGVYGSQIASSYERAGSELGRAANSAEEYVGHQEISAGAASGAQLFSDQLEKKDAAIKAIDPNDPHYGQKVELAVKQWRDQSLEPALDQFANQFHTKTSQDWSQRFVDNTRQSMFVHSAADIQTAAGIGIHNSARTIVNTATNTVFQNPDMLANQIDLVNHGITGLVQSNPVKGVEASKVQSEALEKSKEMLVKSAVQGAIVKNGNWQAIANDPRYSPYVNAAETQQFMRQERMYDNMAKAEARNQRVMTDYVNKQNWNDAADKLELQTLPQKAGDPVVLPPNYWSDLKQMGTKPGVDPARLRALIDNGEKLTDRMNMPKVATDPAVRDSLYAEAAAGTLTEAKIATNITHLDDNDVKRLGDTVKMFRDAEVNDPFVKEALAGAKELIEGKTDLERSMSAGKFASFEYNFLRQYSAAVRAGNVPDNALDLEGGTGDRKPSMISDAMKPYANTVHEMLLKSIGANGLAAPPPVPTSPAVSGPGIVITTKAERDLLPDNTPYTYNGQTFIKGQSQTPAATLAPGQM